MSSFAYSSVSADGGIVDTATVTVYPDKERLRDIIGLCEKTVILKTDENASYYKDYMRKLNYAYYIDEEMLMASQSAVDTYADELLYVFYQLGGYVGLNSISVLNHAGEEAADYISVPVDTLYYYNTSYQLDYELNPAGAMYSDIKWTSSNDSVSVDSTGKCTPTETYSACYATITVTATDYFGDTVSDSVVVAFARTQATGITVDPTEITGKTGESQQIDATVQPTVLGITSADIDDVIWSSSNEDVAAVDGDGNVTFVYGGDCVITATTADGGYTAECAVHVVTNYDALQQLVTTYKNLSLEEENYYPDTYKAYIEKLDAAQQMIDANASTQEEVDNMYKELEAAYNGLKKYTFIQKVELYLDGEATSDYYQYDLSLLSEGLSYKNAQLNLNVRLYPNNASYASVEWTSSTELINVTQDGAASPAQDSSCYGMITCTVTDHFGNQWSDDVWVSFAYYPVTSVSLSESEIAGNVGDQRQLNCVIYPTGDPVFHIGQASIKDVYWESDDETVATVDQNGLVTFTGAGATTIRVTSYDGGFSAQCSVSTSGDRAALNAALSKYAGVNYMDYQYDYGMAFKNAYETAQAAIGDNSLTQSEIDEITLNLNQAGEALTGHEFVAASVIHLAYDNQKQNLLWQYGSKGSGSIADDAATHTYNSSDGTGYKAKTIISASLPSEAAANYTDISWSVADKSGSTDVNISGSTVEVEQGSATASAKAQLLVTATDTYGRTVTRTIRVVVSDDTVSGITLNKDTAELIEGGTLLLRATVTPENATDKKVTWTSDKESVATVSADGKVTAIAVGVAKIKASCGEFSDECTIIVSEKAVTGIMVSKQPTKKIYKVGDVFDPAGVIIMANYNDTSKKDVTFDCEFTPNEPLTEAELRAKGVRAFQRINEGSGSDGLLYRVAMDGSDGEKKFTLAELCDAGLARRKSAAFCTPWEEHGIELESSDVFFAKGYAGIERAAANYRKRYLLTTLGGRTIDKGCDWLIATGLAHYKRCEVSADTPWPEDGAAYVAEELARSGVKSVARVDLGGMHRYKIVFAERGGDKTVDGVPGKNMKLMGFIK